MIIVALVVRVLIVFICLLLIFTNISHAMSSNPKNALVGNLFLLVYIALLIVITGGRLT